MKKHVLQKMALTICNPLNLYRAYAYAKRQKIGINRTQEDPQLRFYSDALGTDMLHYGYFEDIDISGDEISIRDIETAQMAYAKKIAELVSGPDQEILDVGAGMGGLGNLLHHNGHSVTCVTPDKHQAYYIKKNYPELKLIEDKYEDMKEEKSFSTVIHSESLQYISLHEALKKTGQLLASRGEWIISDYFRQAEHRESRFTSGHIFEDFQAVAEENGWSIIYKEDITANILPTLYFAYNCACRVLKPAIEFADFKLKRKQPFIRYYLDPVVQHANKKFEKATGGIDPERFAREKRYLLIKLKVDSSVP
ncbi:MAG: SAM-dependent methyltransferase [Thermodesulfobacteriota bacterium]